MPASAPAGELELQRRGALYYARFRAMASPCEVLIETGQRKEAESLGRLAAREAWRIEAAFSRYRDDNVVHRINHSAGAPVEVDEETARLLDFAAECYELSEGRFDITSGVLRRAWVFDGSDRVPGQQEIDALLGRIGWSRVRWEPPWLQLPAGMEIDFGGIGKEYAVDRIRQLLVSGSDRPSLVNLGGDLAVSGPRHGARPWRAGIEDPHGSVPRGALQISQGALATSGDAHRYLLRDGVRYGHVLDPRSGRPVAGAPRSVTVAAPTCTQAGMLATFALLHGAGAEAFLEAQSVPHWCLR